MERSLIKLGSIFIILALSLACGALDYNFEIGEDHQLFRANTYDIGITYRGTFILDNKRDLALRRVGPLQELNWNDEIIITKQAGITDSEIDYQINQFFIITKHTNKFIGPLTRTSFERRLSEKGYADLKLLNLYEARLKSHLENPTQKDAFVLKEQKHLFAMFYATLIFFLFLPSAIIAYYLEKFAKKRNKKWYVWKIWLFLSLLVPLIVYNLGTR